MSNRCLCVKYIDACIRRRYEHNRHAYQKQQQWKLSGKTVLKGLSLCAMCRSAQFFVQDVCGHFEPCTSAQTNPTPDLTLTLTPTLWEARDRQGQSGAVFPKKLRAAQRPTSTSKARPLHKNSCRPVLHIERVYQTQV